MDNLFIHICVNRKGAAISLVNCHTWTDHLQRIPGIWCNWNDWINWGLIGTLHWFFNFWHALHVCRFCPKEVEMHLIYIFMLQPSWFWWSNIELLMTLTNFCWKTLSGKCYKFQMYCWKISSTYTWCISSDDRWYME